MVHPFPKVATHWYESPTLSLRGGEKKAPGLPAHFGKEAFY
jgi:hypothetical protein